MQWIIFALLYVLVGGIIGSAYAWMTGASGPTRAEVVAWAAIFGPAILLVMYGFREAARKTGIPLARSFYHTLLVTFAAPMFCFGASLLLSALGVSWFARLFKGLSYWSIPLVFVAAASYGFWRATREFERRLERGTTGGSSGTPPSGSGNPGDQSTTAQRTEASGSPRDPIDALRIALAYVRH